MHVYLYVSMRMCVYACMYVCIYVCMNACVFVCMHVYMYVCLYVCMNACVYVCMYACMVCCFALVCVLMLGCTDASGLQNARQPAPTSTRDDLPLAALLEPYSRRSRGLPTDDEKNESFVSSSSDEDTTVCARACGCYRWAPKLWTH
jgi:hypothetical protein